MAAIGNPMQDIACHIDKDARSSDEALEALLVAAAERTVEVGLTGSECVLDVEVADADEVLDVDVVFGSGSSLSPSRYNCRE